MILIYIALFMTVILSFWGLQIYNYNAKIDRTVMNSFSQQLMLEHQQAVDTAQDPFLLGDINLDEILGNLYANDTVIYPTSPNNFLKKCYDTSGTSQNCFGAGGLYQRTYDENLYQIKNKVTADPNIGWVQLVSFVDMSESAPISQRDLYRAFVDELGYNLQFGLIDSSNSDAFGDYIVRTGVTGVNDRRVSSSLLESPSGRRECLDRNNECFVMITDIAPIAKVLANDVLVDIGEVNETVNIYNKEYPGVVINDDPKELTFSISDGINANPQVNLSITISGYNEKGELVPSLDGDVNKNGFNANLLDLEDIVFKDDSGNVITNADNAYTEDMVIEVTPNFNQWGGAFVTVTATYEGTNVNESNSVQQDSMTFLVMSSFEEEFKCNAADPLSGFSTRNVGGTDYFLIGSQLDSSDTERATSQLSCISQHQTAATMGAKYLMVTNADFEKHKFPWYTLGTFTGELDGGSHSINKMPSGGKTGMFWNVSGATIKNIDFIGGAFVSHDYQKRGANASGFIYEARGTVVIENISLSVNVRAGSRPGKTGSAYSGGLVKLLHGGGVLNISGLNLTFEGNVYGGDFKHPFSGSTGNLGGVVGDSYGNINIANSNIKINVTSYVNGVGGITPYLRNNNITVDNVSVDITNNGGHYIGGFVGYSEGRMTITNSHSSGTIRGTDNIGGFVGSGNIQEITNSYSSGIISGRSNVGGLVGDGPSDLIINDSYSTADVNGANSVGGLVGRDAKEVNRSYFSGNVTGGGQDIGGLVGYSPASINIFNSYSSGSVKGGHDVGGLIGDTSAKTVIKESYSRAAISGSYHIGGLVGDGSFGLSINDSYRLGNVVGTGENVGGLVGHSVKEITNSYAFGHVHGTHDTGGLVGENTAVANAIIKGSFFDGGDVKGGYRVGGLVGQGNNTLTVRESYAKADVSGTGYDVGGLVGYRFLNLLNSYHEGEVEGSIDTVGGVVGFSDGVNMKINNVFHRDGSVTAPNGKRVGGLVGVGSNTMVIEDSYAKADITGKYRDIGGLVGWSAGRVSNSYHIGNVESLNSHAVGGLVGSVDPAKLIINNSYHVGRDVSGHHAIGGLVGWGHNDMEIIDSYSKGNVTATAHNGYGNSLAGGLVGYRFKTIENSYAVGNITGPYNSIGGLAGYTEATNPSVKNSFFEGQARGRSYIGGLVGRGTNSLTVDNVYTKGTDNSYQVAIGSEDFIGGIVGRYFKSISKALVTHEYAYSSAFFKDVVRGRHYVGGIAGIVGVANALIEKATVEGGVNIFSSAGRNMIGGIIGQGNNSLTIKECQTRGARGLNWVGGIVGRYVKTIENSYVKSGSVGGKAFSSAEDYIGGLIGQATGTTTITDSAVSSDVYIRGRNYIGGIVGRGDTVIINDSFRETGYGSSTGANVGSIYGSGNVTINNQNGLCENNVKLVRGNCSMSNANTIGADWDSKIWYNRAANSRSLKSKVKEKDIISPWHSAFWMDPGETHVDHSSAPQISFTNNEDYPIIDLQWKRGASRLSINRYWDYSGDDIENPDLRDNNSRKLTTLPIIDWSDDAWKKNGYPPILREKEDLFPVVD
ncbi:MAG: hypothetical protein OIF36_04775 [Alphaproteobacteria bacterium]|nr:hypothetical protein [Alphaproteobacteria bacterium]